MTLEKFKTDITEPDEQTFLDALDRLFPDIARMAKTPVDVAEKVYKWANTQTDDFLNDLMGKGRTPDTETMLKGFGFKDDHINKLFVSERITAKEPWPQFPQTPQMPKLTWLDKVSELREDPEQLIPFVSSGVEIYTIGKLLKAAKDFDDDKEISIEDLMALQEYVDRSLRERDWGYKVAEVVSQMIPFAGEFIATGGIFAVGKTAAVKGATVALKKLATKTGAKLLERRLTQLGVQAVGTVAGGTLRALTTGIVRVPAKTLEKQLQTTLTGDEESVWSSAKKAFGEHWVEIVSESTGGMLNELTNPIKGQLIKMGLFKAFLRTNPQAKVNDLSRIFKRMGYHGVLGEMFEERVGEVAHGVLEPLGLSDQKFRIPSLEQLSVELAAFAVPGVALKVAEGIPWAVAEARLAPERGGIKLPGEEPVTPEVTIPKELQPLIEEARKYASFEDFEDALFSKEWQSKWRNKEGIIGDVVVMGFPKATEQATGGRYIVTGRKGMREFWESANAIPKAPVTPEVTAKPKKYFTLKKAQDAVRIIPKYLTDEQLDRHIIKLRDFKGYLDRSDMPRLIEGGYYKRVMDPSATGLVPKDMFLQINLRQALDEATKEKSSRPSMTTIPEAVTPEVAIPKDIPMKMRGLAAEALKYDTFEDFSRAFSLEIRHGRYYHITDNPNFTIDPQIGPRDMSSLAGQAIPEKGKLMITSDLDYWDAMFEGVRQYVAVIDMSKVPKEQYWQVNRGFGNEFWVDDPSMAKVEKVIPVKQAKAEDKAYFKALPQSEEEAREFYDKVKGLALPKAEVGMPEAITKLPPTEPKPSPEVLEATQRAAEEAGGVIPPTKPPVPPLVDISQPSPSITPGPMAKNVIGLRTIQPGLVRSEVIANWARRLVSKVYIKLGGRHLVEADPLANPAMRERARVWVTIEAKANVVGTKAEADIASAFIRDKKGGIPALEGVDTEVIGSPTIQDVAARLPRYKDHLTSEQIQVMEDLKMAISPYHDLLTEVGVEVPSRPDIMEGGFYLPRGRAALEGTDEPVKVGGGRKGLRKGFERPALFTSQAEGINKGYEYSPIGEALSSYASDAGTRATEAHVSNYFKALTDETGQLLGETPKMRMLRQNPEIAKTVDEIKDNLNKLKRNIGALTERQMQVIDLWQHDPEFTDIDILLEGLETMRGGQPPQTLANLKALFEQNKEALKALRPSYKVALRRAMVTPRDQGVIIMPALLGRTFPNEVANAANKVLKAEGETTGALAPAVNVVNAYNNLYRGLRATLDNSAVGIQGLLGMYGAPTAYYKALKVNIKAWGIGGNKVLGKFFSEFDVEALRQGEVTIGDWAKAGMHFGGATHEFELGAGLGGKISDLPVVRQANRAFGFLGDTLRATWARNELRRMLRNRTLEEIKASGDMERIANATNVMTGWATTKTFGSFGDLVMFAPRWFQSRLETVAKAGMGFRPGASVDQKMARNAILRMIGLGVMLTVAANMAQGEDTDFRLIVDGKRNPKFVRVKFRGRYYSLFGPWDSLLGMIVNVGTGRVLTAARGTAAGLVSAAWDIITGKDYNFKPTRDTPAHFAQWVMSQFIPFGVGGIPEGVKEIVGGEVPGGLVDIGSQVLGVKSFPVFEADALKAVPQAITRLGGLDKVGLEQCLKENVGVSPEKLAEINAKNWTYDITSLRRDIGDAIRGLPSEDVTEKAGFPPIVMYYRDVQGYNDMYSLLSNEEQVQYLKANPDVVVGMLFWGHRVSLKPDRDDWPTSLKTAQEIDRFATEYKIPLNLIPAFGLTESGKQRMPPKNLWADYFTYYELNKPDGSADTSARNAFRKSHPEFSKWGETVGEPNWKPLSGTTSSGGMARWR